VSGILNKGNDDDTTSKKMVPKQQPMGIPSEGKPKMGEYHDGSADRKMTEPNQKQSKLNGNTGAIGDGADSGSVSIN